MPPRTWLVLLRVCFFVGAGFAVIAPSPLAAQNVPNLPVVGPGATKEEALNAYGWPTGQSQAGTKEILTYPQGQITLEDGKVERVDFSTTTPWPAPRPRPGGATPTTVKKAEAPTDFWVTDFGAAQVEARRRKARILALFLGSDWSPPSMQFQGEVAFQPDFVNAFTGDFVFLRLDFPTRAPQPQALHDQNAALRTKYNVTTYPSLLVLSPAGTLVGTVDLAKVREGEFRTRVIAAVRELRDALIARPPPPDPVAVTVVAAATPAPAAAAITTDTRVASSVSSAFTLILGGVGVALLGIGLAWWLLWRKGTSQASAPTTSMAERISDAASGLPSLAQMGEWPKEKVVVVTRGLAEADGYSVAAPGDGSDGDLNLFRPGAENVDTIVACAGGNAGKVSAKKLRELFGSVALEGARAGWYVAPGGFSPEARDYAKEHALFLVDAEQMIAQFRALPEITLRRILARK